MLSLSSTNPSLPSPLPGPTHPRTMTASLLLLVLLVFTAEGQLFGCSPATTTFTAPGEGFHPTPFSPLPAPPLSIHVKDIDGDMEPDVVFGMVMGGWGVLWGNASSVIDAQGNPFSGPNILALLPPPPHPANSSLARVAVADAGGRTGIQIYTQILAQIFVPGPLLVVPGGAGVIDAMVVTSRGEIFVSGAPVLLFPILQNGNWGPVPVALNMTVLGKNQMALLDLTGDGEEDLVGMVGGSTEVDIVVSFAPPRGGNWSHNHPFEILKGPITSESPLVGSLLAGDIDGDSVADLVSATTAQSTMDLSVFRTLPGSRSSTLDLDQHLVAIDALSLTLSLESFLGLVDINRDGALDLIVASPITNNVRMFVSAASGLNWIGPVTIANTGFPDPLDVVATYSPPTPDIGPVRDTDVLFGFGGGLPRILSLNRTKDVQISFTDDLTQAGTVVDDFLDLRFLLNVDIDWDEQVDIVAPSGLYQRLAGSGNLDVVLGYQVEDNFGPFVHVLDLDRDGILDLLSRDRTDVYWWRNLDGNNAGTFAPPVNVIHIDDTNILVVETLVTDLTMDGQEDIVALVVSSLTLDASVLLFPRVNATSAVNAFAPTGTLLGTPFTKATLSHTSSTVGLSVGHRNNDGIPDVGLAMGDRLVWLVSAGPGIWSTELAIPTTGIAFPHQPLRPTLAHLDNDTFPDFVITTSDAATTGMLWVYYATDDVVGSPYEEVVISVLGGGDAWGGIEVGDVNGDGKEDIVGMAGNAGVRIFINPGGSRVPFWDFHVVKGTSASEGAPEPILAASIFDVSGDGVMDLTLFSNSFFWTSLGSVSLPVTYPGPNLVVDATPFVSSTPAGYTVSSIVQAITQSLGSCARAIQIKLPTAYTYTGCFSGAGYEIVEGSSVELLPLPDSGGSGRVLIDCQVGPNPGGVLFTVTGGASLTLVGVDVVGATSTTADTSSTAPLVVVGANSVLTLKDTSFTDCTSEVGTGGAPQTLPGVGGAVSVSGAGSLVVEDSRFIRNTAADGGGAIGVAYSASAVISRSVFEDNVAGTQGGGVYVDLLSTLSVDDSVFERNSAGAGGGGLYVSTQSVVTLADSRLSENVAARGGGIFLTGDARLTLDAVELSRNDASGAGGAVLIAGSLTQLNGVGVDGTENTAGYGGFLAAGLSLDLLPVTGGLTSDVLPVTSGGFSQDALPSVLLTESVGLDANVAVFGSAFYSCGASLVVDGIGSTLAPSVSTGSPVFVCLDIDMVGMASPMTSVPRFVPLDVTPGVLLGASTSPVVSLEVTGTPTGVVSGTALVTGQATLRDVFGVPTTDDEVGVRVAGLPPVSLVGQSAVSVTSGGLVELGGVSVAVPVESVGAGGMIEVSLSNVRAVFIGAQVDVDVLACPVGFGRESNERAPLECSPCASGSVSDVVSTDPCVLQPRCPNNAVFLNVTLSASCVCLAGFFPSPVDRAASNNTQFSTVSEDCLECVPGGFCSGGLEDPVAAPGYFPDALLDSTFYECIRPEACVGNGTCATNYEGFMCTVCSEDAFRDTDGACSACPSSSIAFSLLFVLAGGLSVTLASVVYVIVRRTIATQKTTISGGLGVIRSLNMLIIYLQLFAVIGQTAVAWSSSAKSAFKTVSAANFSLELFSAECATGDYFTQFGLAMVLPLVCYVLMVVVIVVLNVWRPSTGWTRWALIRVMGLKALAWFSPLAYVSLSRVTLSFFDCSQLPSGDYVLDIDTSESCYTETWVSYLGLALFGLVVYVIGVPVMLLTLLYRSSGKLHTLSVFASLGGLYASFRTEVSLYELVLMARRLGVVVIVTFLTLYPAWQILLLFLLITGSLVVSARMLPYRFFHHNALETVLNICTLVLVACGTVFLSVERASTSAEQFASVVVIGSLLVAVLFSGWTFWRELRYVVGVGIPRGKPGSIVPGDGEGGGVETVVGVSGKSALPFFARPVFVSPLAQIARSTEVLKVYAPHARVRDGVFDAVIAAVKGQVDMAMVEVGDLSEYDDEGSTSGVWGGGDAEDGMRMVRFDVGGGDEVGSESCLDDDDGYGGGDGYGGDDGYGGGDGGVGGGGDGGDGGDDDELMMSVSAQDFQI